MASSDRTGTFRFCPVAPSLLTGSSRIPVFPCVSHWIADNLPTTVELQMKGSHTGEGGNGFPLLSFVLRVFSLRSQVLGRYYRALNRL